MAATTNSIASAATAKTVLDLTSAVLNLSNASSPLINGAIEIGQWLGREKLNREELGFCLDRAKSLVLPNDAGLTFCEQVREGDLRKPVPHVFLKQSGALGRMLVSDPRLCWIVSTTAALFQFHSDTAFIADVLCTLLMRRHVPAATMTAQEEWEGRYQPDRVQTNFVANRIVSSVWWNVVNAGYKIINLPAKLEEVCVKKHLLSSSSLGSVLHAIINGSPRLILKSQHLLANVTLWLVLHHCGLLRVIVSGRTIYEKLQGDAGTEIEVRVAEFCPPEADKKCAEENILSYEVLEDLGSKERSLISGTYDSVASNPASPSVRRPLYDIPKIYPQHSRANRRSIQELIQNTAFKIIEWLLRVPLLAPQDFSNLGFQAAPGHSPDVSTITIGTILSRVPGIVHMRWDTADLGSLVFANLDEEDSTSGKAESDVDMDDYDIGLEKDRELQEVLPYFPILENLMQEIRAVCQCVRCRDDTRDQSLLQPGCLRRIAFQEVLLLIAHAVADGFGCMDVSGSSECDPVIEATTVLLLELSEGKKVVWDTWFSVAACVYLGCKFHHHIMDLENSGTTYAAIQCGNLCVIAPWLDVSVKLDIQGCFGLIAGQGVVGVLRGSVSDPDMFIFRGIEEEFAIIQTEHTEDTSSFASRFPKESFKSGQSIEIDTDESALESDMFLVSAGANAYRFLFRVRTGNHSRMIDPSAAVVRLARGIRSHNCSHSQERQPLIGIVRNDSFVYSMDEIVGRWSNLESFYGFNKADTGPVMLNVNADRQDQAEATQTLPKRLKEEDAADISAGSSKHRTGGKQRELSPSGIIHHSFVLKSHLHLNIALALAVDDATILNDGTSCISCTEEQVLAVPLPAFQTLLPGETVTRTVIHLQSHLVHMATAGLKRKRIAASNPI